MELIKFETTQVIDPIPNETQKKKERRFLVLIKRLENFRRQAAKSWVCCWCRLIRTWLKFIDEPGSEN